MRHFTNILTLLVAFNICSCASSTKLIREGKTDYGKIRFYEVKTSGKGASVNKVYAAVDSNGIKKYYSFYPQRIVMTDERAKELSYTVLFQQLPVNYDSNIYCQLSPLDTLVLTKGKKLLKAAEYSHLKSSEGATGFEIEINYMHGFPKNRKFRPL